MRLATHQKRITGALDLYQGSMTPCAADSSTRTPCWSLCTPLANRACVTQRKDIQMRPFKITGMLFVLAMAISAFASTAAFALPEILDHVPSTFTATGGEAQLVDPTSKLTIKCEKLSVLLANGKVLTATTIETTIDFEQCSIGGLAAISLGAKNDAEGKKLGLILSLVKGELCYIGEAKNKEAGIFFLIPPVHIEVLSLAELLEVVNNPTTKIQSSVVALITPNNKLQTGPYTLTTKGIKQECDGKKAQILMDLNMLGKPLAAEEIATATITMDEDEEMMVV